MPEWPNPTATADATDATVVGLESALIRLEEAYDLARAELAADDAGWQSIAAAHKVELTRPGLDTIARNCRVLAICSPLAKRGLALRSAYVWGQGVRVTAKDSDVNAVVQQMWDDATKTLTGSQANDELERALGTDGNVFIAAFTSPLTGRLQLRTTPFEEIKSAVTNPEDRDDTWYYLREYETADIEAGTKPGTTRTVNRTRRVYHPALGHYPATRPRTLDGVPIRWDAPIRHVAVNRLDGTTWGVPDVYASMSWIRGYEEFLSNWARIVKALSRYAWRISGDSSRKTRSVVRQARAAAGGDRSTGTLPVPPLNGDSDPIGGTAGISGATIEAVPKTGATIDSGSGRPLAAMIAAGFGVPVTMLLADPGVTGARATAETLDAPTILEMSQRRDLWGEVFADLAQYAIHQAIKAPRGALTGTVTRDEWGREQYTLAGDTPNTVDVDWPSLEKTDIKTLIDAIAAADETRKVDPVIIMRLLLVALGVKDVDEHIDAATDDQGQWVDRDLNDAQAAIDAYRRGDLDAA